MDAWAVYTAIIATIGALAAITTLARNIVKDRSKVKVTLRCVLHSAFPDQKMIEVNVYNGTGREVQIANVGFRLSNGSDLALCPNVLQGNIRFEHGKDYSFFSDPITMLQKRIAQQDSRGAIKFAWVRDDGDRLHKGRVTKSIQRIITESIH